MSPRERETIDRHLKAAETAMSAASLWAGLSVLFAAANFVWCLWRLF